MGQGSGLLIVLACQQVTQIRVLQAQEEGNVTVSVLKFTPKAEDDGAMLICQATNEKLPDQAVQDSRLLSINCE